MGESAVGEGCLPVYLPKNQETRKSLAIFDSRKMTPGNKKSG